MVAKIAVTLEQKTVADLDRWVREGRYPNRSRALQSASHRQMREPPTQAIEIDRKAIDAASAVEKPAETPTAKATARTLAAKSC